MACQSDDERADDVKAMLERAALNRCDGNYVQAKRFVALRLWAQERGYTRDRVAAFTEGDMPREEPCEP